MILDLDISDYATHNKEKSNELFVKHVSKEKIINENFIQLSIPKNDKFISDVWMSAYVADASYHLRDDKEQMEFSCRIKPILRGKLGEGYVMFSDFDVSLTKTNMLTHRIPFHIFYEANWNKEEKVFEPNGDIFYAWNNAIKNFLLKIEDPTFVDFQAKTFFYGIKVTKDKEPLPFTRNSYLDRPPGLIKKTKNIVLRNKHEFKNLLPDLAKNCITYRNWGMERIHPDIIKELRNTNPEIFI